MPQHDRLGELQQPADQGDARHRLRQPVHRAGQVLQGSEVHGRGPGPGGGGREEGLQREVRRREAHLRARRGHRDAPDPGEPGGQDRLGRPGERGVPGHLARGARQDTGPEEPLLRVRREGLQHRRQSDQAPARAGEAQAPRLRLELHPVPPARPRGVQHGGRGGLRLRRVPRHGPPRRGRVPGPAARRMLAAPRLHPQEPPRAWGGSSSATTRRCSSASARKSTRA